MTTVTEARPRRTQADRRAKTQGALLEAAARGLSRYGYGNLVLEKVARDAGYTRGALYHLFANKEELALAVVAWVQETWWAEMGPRMAQSEDPVDALRAMARGHAIFCRRDIARVRMVLAIELGDHDHPVGRAVQEASERLLLETERLIEAGRKNGSIPPGPPPGLQAIALLGAIEGLVITLAGQAPHDEELADRAVLGVLGLPVTHEREVSS